MYVLYGGDFTRAPLVQWVLEEGGIDYDFRRIDIVRGQHRSPEFLKLNPAGQVPVLVTPDGTVMTEVAALMLYLADRHRLQTLVPPDGHTDRGAFLSSYFWVADEVQPTMKRFHFPHRYALRPEENGAVQGLARQQVLDLFELMEQRLGNRGPFVLGSRFSLADAYLCFWIAYLDRPAVCATRPAIARLYGQVREKPGIGPILAETEQAACDYARMQAAAPMGVIR